MSELPSRPRVLVVGSQWPPQTFLHRLFSGLAERFEILVASRTPLGSGPFERVALPMETWPRALRAARSSLAAARALSHPMGRKLFRADGCRRLDVLQKPVDAIYFPWNSAATSHLSLMRLGLPTIVSCRGSQVQVAPFQPERREQTAALHESFELATLVHCVSQATLESARLQGLAPAKGRVIRPAVDTEHFAPMKRARSESSATRSQWRFVAVGSLIWLKGFEDALVALRGLLDRGLDVRLDLAGDGRDRQRLLFAVHDLGLEDHVVLHGAVPPQRVKELMQRADIFVLPSLSEGIANVALEAMACGLPVVACDCGGMGEAISDEVEGLLVPPQNPKALEASMARLIEDEKLRQRLGENARQRVDADFRLEDQVERFGELIFEAIRLNI